MKIVGFAGSLRKGSFNRKLLKLALEKAEKLGAKTETFELDLPLYNNDVEEKGFPASVEKLRKAVSEADGVIITVPEYNHSFSGVLKNAIDWLSRDPNALKGKAIAVTGASTGRIGTARAQMALKPVLLYLDNNVLGQPEVLVSNAQSAFDENGKLTDTKTDEMLHKLIERLVKAAEKKD